MTDSDIETRAEAGEVGAQLALGLKCQCEGATKLARGWLARAGKAGNIEATRRLGEDLLTRQPIAPTEGVAFLRAAAEAGDGEAMHFCARLAAQDDDLPDHWNVALDYAGRAAEAGYELAAREQALMEDIGGIAAIQKPMPLRVIRETPYMAVIEKFLSPELCDWLIAQATPRLERAEVYDVKAGGSQVADARNNSSFSFDLSHIDLILLAIRERIAASTQFALAALELTTVLHYAPGQRFTRHHDYLQAEYPGHAQDMALRGQRVATFLVYLNDEFDGGETDFPLLNFRHKGKRGDAFLFWNVDPMGAPDLRTLHAGLPPANGEKWVLSQWLRQPPG
jgi:prolyl 4-hydroxylase